MDLSVEPFPAQEARAPGDAAEAVFVRKLAWMGPLTAADRAALEQVCARSRRYGPHAELLRQGEVPDSAIVVLQGFAGRYRHRSSGACQILAHLLPGDLCDPNLAYPRAMDHTVGTLSSCTVARIPRESYLTLVEQHPAVARALDLARLVDEAVAREWLVSIGRRSARERLAHLFCELHARLARVGLTSGYAFDLHLTQVGLSDTTALTSVHVNRTLRDMRREDLIELKGRRFVIRDPERLRAIAEFDGAYLRPAEIPPSRPPGDGAANAGA
ncbi:Crp/Fnr family transcriptional regulator [Methylobacterium dankookense]|uniref:Transcriptional activatory protein AadR n=1 Tax=Methylobacterium dankookense TaxID=560405 RepID=A0A564FU48_9HYPH|nr:Crp/Fnr family transcriptional regulator [Methylobacterium dankookense]GJD56023.1 Transcriptional activatory protein AadR [Methylobacterium dankookense]VUF11384.1 Transcriptional activatory protein AadR [Methylobacterium dankookense]